MQLSFELIPRLIPGNYFSSPRNSQFLDALHATQIIVVILQQDYYSTTVIYYRFISLFFSVLKIKGNFALIFRVSVVQLLLN